MKAEFKQGDKVRIKTQYYSGDLEKGTICEVVGPSHIDGWIELHTKDSTVTNVNINHIEPYVERYGSPYVETAIKQLSALIHKYNHEYYILDKTSVTDSEYDETYKRLVTLEKLYPEFKRDDSPTQPIEVTEQALKEHHKLRREAKRIKQTYGEFEKVIIKKVADIDNLSEPIPLRAYQQAAIDSIKNEWVDSRVFDHIKTNDSSVCHQVLERIKRPDLLTLKTRMNSIVRELETYIDSDRSPRRFELWDELTRLEKRLQCGHSEAIQKQIDREYNYSDERDLSEREKAYHDKQQNEKPESEEKVFPAAALFAYDNHKVKL